MFLHIVLLEKEKLLLHVSIHNKENMSIIMLECELIYKYTLIYKPLRIVETIVICQNDEINFFVKKYMKYYGIDNVRGGSYTNTELTNEERNHITNELLQDLEINRKQCNIIFDIIEKYKDIDTLSTNKIKLEYETCKKQQNKYDYETQMLGSFTVCHENIAQNRLILSDLKWIINHCGKTIKLEGTYTPTDEIIEKYKKIVIKIKSMYVIFTKYLDEKNIYEPEIHLSNPELLLDQYFYNSNITDCIIHYDSVSKYIEMCEFMAYCIICRTQEYDFDVKSYPPNFEMSNKYEMSFLEKHINECLPKSCDILNQS